MQVGELAWGMVQPLFLANWSRIGRAMSRVNALSVSPTDCQYAIGSVPSSHPLKTAPS
jgi:hypothetical protein